VALRRIVEDEGVDEYRERMVESPNLGI